MKTAIDLTHLRPLDHKTSMRIAANENELFAKLLHGLDGREWELPTDCELWTVRDIVAHMIGWGEALTSPREGVHQFVAARRRRREFGMVTDAQNQVQVDERRHLTIPELLATYESAADKLLRLRRRIGVVGKAIPLYNPLLGGLSNVGFAADAIFTRDTFMHRIDISRATGRDMVMGLHQDILVSDIVRDWARRTRLPVRAELEGPGGGVFAHDDARITIRATAIDFIRFFAGRASEDDLELDGRSFEVKQALAARPPF